MYRQPIDVSLHYKDTQGYTGIHGNGYISFEFDSISYNTLPQWKRIGLHSRRSRVQDPSQGDPGRKCGTMQGWASRWA
jgi:hypothetical protein